MSRLRRWCVAFVLIPALSGAISACSSSSKSAGTPTSQSVPGTRAITGGGGGGFCFDLNRLLNQTAFQTAASLIDKPEETAGQRQSDVTGWLGDYQRLIGEAPADIKAALQTVAGATQGEDDALRAVDFQFSTSDSALEAALARFDAPDVRGAQQQIATYAQSHCVSTP